MAFYVGQKVVCVDDDQRTHTLPAQFTPVGDMGGLKKGVIYTVRRFGNDEIGLLTIWLEEIYREIHPLSVATEEPGYSPHRFRPVVERKTDISIFKAMLNPSDERVSA